LKPKITLTVGGGKQEALLRGSLDKLVRSSVYVGVPETTASDRQAQILKLLSSAKGAKRKAHLAAAAKLLINNAQAVFLATMGSPLRHRPPRPIIEPAIEDPENKKLISDELMMAATASFEGRKDDVAKYLKRAGLLAETLVKTWFTSPKNHWAPNAPSTIRRKGSSRPNIDTAAMQKAITSIVSEI
jgi:hypothetical protein